MNALKFSVESDDAFDIKDIPAKSNKIVIRS